MKPSKTKLKQYPFHQSPLFKLRGLGQLESLLGINISTINQLHDSSNYRVWKNSKEREIQEPIGLLQKIHKRIGWLLSCVELPDYVFSKKGRSYIDNALQHLGEKALIKTDISSFYPSVTHFMVYEMFAVKFECAKDIAKILANICCYRQEHLPTGSALSGRVAFFVAQVMFDEINSFVRSYQCIMTVYVDDITISGDLATKRMLGEVRKIISRYGFITKHKKSVTFAPKNPKIVTGVVIVGNEIRLPNNRHLKLCLVRKEFEAASHDERLSLRLILTGRLLEAQQILSRA